MAARHPHSTGRLHRAARPRPAGRPAARSVALRDRVADQVRDLVGRVSTADYQADLIAVLSRPGRLLGPRPERAIWPLFPIVVYEALTGSALPAVPAAAAIEVFAAAADLFDDLEDGDLTDHLADWPTGRLVNAASGLLVLAQIALIEAPIDSIPAVRWQNAGTVLARAALVASGGQAADLAAEDRPSVTVDECVGLARDKAGALVAAACQMGAVLATDDPVIIAIIGEFGTCLGITHQFLNDLNDLRSLDHVAWKSDLCRRKKTLPITYALGMVESSDDLDPVSPAAIFRHLIGGQMAKGLSAADERSIREWLLDIGALHFTGLLADLYRRRAEACLAQLESCLGAGRTAEVAVLLPKLEPLD